MDCMINIKTVIIIILMNLITNNICAQLPYECSSIDSIYVLSIEFDIETPISVSKTRFEEYLYQDGKYDIVTDRNKINKICKILSNLMPLSPDSMSCNYNTQKILIDKQRVPRFIDIDTLNIRTLLVLQIQNKQVLIWIGTFYTEIACERYITSEDLYSYIYNYKYSHILQRKE